MKARHLVLEDDPKSIGSEAFRTLRTNLQFTSPDRELHSILITSSGPDEGKSTVSANLAIAMSQVNKKVILVGCDLRKPVLHETLGVPNAPGLTAALTGQARLEDIVLNTHIKNLQVVPAGPIPPNPAELLVSDAMKKALAYLKERADMIILDGAPVIAVTDAALLATQVDGVVLVVGANKVPRDAALHAKSLLDQAKARILGVVLNGVKPENQPNYHYYYYYTSNEKVSS